MNTFHDRYRSVCLGAIIAGAAGSVGFTLYTGRRNPSAILMVLFIGWVLAPFAVFAWANGTSKRRPHAARSDLQWVMLALTFGMLIVYGYVALGPPMVKTAAPFLMVPAISLLVIGIAALRGRRT